MYKLRSTYAVCLVIVLLALNNLGSSHAAPKDPYGDINVQFVFIKIESLNIFYAT